MHRRLTRLLFMGALLIAAFGAIDRASSQSRDATEAIVGALIGAANAAEPAVVVVNGSSLAQRDVSAYAQSRGIRDDSAQGREALVQELINRELLYQEALAKGLDKNPDIAAAIENQKRTLIADLMANAIATQTQPTEAQMREFYQQNVAGKSTKEYKTRHIIVDSEAKAKQALGELAKGGDFAKIAKERSAGPMAESGGDLGWMSLRQMVPPVAKAVTALSKGAYTKTPVQTQFGWHVIRLDDTREVPAPPLDAIQNQIRAILQQRALTDHLAKLRSEASIRIPK